VIADRIGDGAESAGLRLAVPLDPQLAAAFDPHFAGPDRILGISTVVAVDLDGDIAWVRVIGLVSRDPGHLAAVLFKSVASGGDVVDEIAATAGTCGFALGLLHVARRTYQRPWRALPLLPGTAQRYRL
jgi:hypothetical protein